MPLKTVSTDSTARVNAVWAAIERTVQETCALRCEGYNEQAARLLKDKLPPLIQDWSAHCGLSVEVCRATLRDLFTRAQERVATAQLCKRFVLNALAEPAAVTTPVGALPKTALHVRRRVPVGDIAGMIDALSEADADRAIGQRQNFPTTASVPLPALAVA